MPMRRISKALVISLMGLKFKNYVDKIIIKLLKKQNITKKTEHVHYNKLVGIGTVNFWEYIGLSGCR